MPFKRRRGTPPGEGREINLWITPFADMMTTLMIFFLILWGRFQMAAVQRQQKMRETVQTVRQTLERRRLEEFATVEVEKRWIRIGLSRDVLFRLGSAELDPQILPILDRLAWILRLTPSSVVVEGHTDDLPIRGGPFRDNLALSAARAFSVIRYFIEKGGLEPGRFAAWGFGEKRPLVPNDSPENRAKNRRIEIRLLPDEVGPQSLLPGLARKASPETLQRYRQELIAYNEQLERGELSEEDALEYLRDIVREFKPLGVDVRPLEVRIRRLAAEVKRKAAAAPTKAAPRTKSKTPPAKAAPTPKKPAAKPVPKSKPAGPVYADYVVQPGDTLEQIAQMLFGDSTRWKEIWQANQEVLKDPQTLPPGQKIKIPLE